MSLNRGGFKILKNIILAAMLILIIILIILSFTLKNKTVRMICSIGYNLAFAFAVIYVIKMVPEMSIEQLQTINHNGGFGIFAGFFVIVISGILETILRKKKKKKNSSVYFLAFLGFIMIVGSNLLTMTTYVEIIKKEQPVVTNKENVTVYTNTQYFINDLIEVENSHGEEIVKIVWAKGAYDDTSGIVIADDNKSFTVTNGTGNLQVQIAIHGIKYSDISNQTVYVTVE